MCCRTTFDSKTSLNCSLLDLTCALLIGTKVGLKLQEYFKMQTSGGGGWFVISDASDEVGVLKRGKCLLTSFMDGPSVNSHEVS